MSPRPAIPRLRLGGIVSAACLLLAVLLTAPSRAAAQDVEMAPFGGQPFFQPTYVTSPPGDAHRVFVTQIPGEIALVVDGVTRPTPFLDIASKVLDLNEPGSCECGMFSMAFAPDYATSGLFYVFYTRDDPSPGASHYLRVEEYRRSAADPDVADPSSGRVVLEVPHPDTGYHNGGQIQFGPDGFLYVSTGDGGTPDEARSLTSGLGKLLRIDPRGTAPLQHSIPPGNPFADGAGPNVDEIYAYGLRNPFRFSFDRATGDLAIGDVGQGDWEEVDFRREGAPPGADFGWDCLEADAFLWTAPPSCWPPPETHVPPVFKYAHAGGASITGGFVIRDSALPSLEGRYIYADSSGGLPDGFVRTVRLSAKGSSDDASTGITSSIPISFGQDACGHIYMAELGGEVRRLQPVAGPYPCKLAPQLEVTQKAAKHAAKRGAVVLRASCDEDCSLDGAAVIRIGERSLTTDAGSIRLQAGVPQDVRLDLSGRQTRKLRKALGKGRRAVARWRLEASGGGGGSVEAAGRVKQRR